jgi:hypothetical protein
LLTFYFNSILKIEQPVAQEQQRLPYTKAGVQERATYEPGCRLDSSIQNSKFVKVQYGDTLADIASANGYVRFL